MKQAEQHIHGGTPEHDFAKFNIPQCEILDFSVNISPLGPPAPIKDSWQKFSAEVERYPSIDGNGVKTFYAKKYGIGEANVLPGNGSTECIYLVPRVLKFKKAVILTPSFYDYGRSCKLASIPVKAALYKMDSGFAVPQLDTIEQLMDDADALMIGHPNNPTGSLFSPDDILTLSDQYPEKWVLIDEAFMQFVENSDQYTFINEHRFRKNILIFQSLTKFYALPGLRLGCVIGHEETIAKLSPHKEPWTVNGIANQVALDLLKCQDYEHQLESLIKTERERMYAEYRQLSGIQVFAPTANFFLAKWDATNNLDDLIRELLCNGLYIRDCRNFVGLEENYFRFAIRTQPENNQLLAVITQSVQKRQ